MRTAMEEVERLSSEAKAQAADHGAEAEAEAGPEAGAAAEAEAEAAAAAAALRSQPPQRLRSASSARRRRHGTKRATPISDSAASRRARPLTAASTVRCQTRTLRGCRPPLRRPSAPRKWHPWLDSLGRVPRAGR